MSTVAVYSTDGNRASCQIPLSAEWRGSPDWVRRLLPEAGAYISKHLLPDVDRALRDEVVMLVFYPKPDKSEDMPINKGNPLVRGASVYDFPTIPADFAPQSAPTCTAPCWSP